MFENIVGFFKKLLKKEEEEENNKDMAKERLHLVLMQDRANVSADFLEMMKQEIIDVIKKYIDVDEKEIDVHLTSKANEDGTASAPALYANIPIVSIKHTGEMDDEVVEKVQEQDAQNIKTEKETANKTEIKKEENKEETTVEAKKEEEKVEELKKASNASEEPKKEKEAKTTVEKTVKQEENVSDKIEQTTTDVKDDDKKDTEPKETNNEQVNAGVKENNISTKQENKNIITNSQVKQEPVIHNNRKRRNKRRKGRR